MIQIHYPGPAAEFAERRLLTQPCGEFLENAIGRAARRTGRGGDWRLEIGDRLLFDASGLEALLQAVQGYRGAANELGFRLLLRPNAYRDYYSLSSDYAQGGVLLPVTARRTSATAGDRREVLDLDVGHFERPADYPRSLADADMVHTPMALLMEYGGAFDLLFANQIAVFTALARSLRRSPLAWLRGGIGRHGSWARRASLAWSEIHRSAEIHPTAVVEGSVIEAGAQIGAHCVVRYSRIGRDARLFDGAKAEGSVVGPRSWLMHDLVLFRCHVEDEVFLIHGPYQFSCFQSGSAAFATIMMDYRPDAKPIRARTDRGVQPYQGRFLGAVLQEGSKSLGGSLLGPGMIVPPHTWLAGDLAQIHKPGRQGLPVQTPVPPEAAGRGPVVAPPTLNTRAS